MLVWIAAFLFEADSHGGAKERDSQIAMEPPRDALDQILTTVFLSDCASATTEVSI